MESDFKADIEKIIYSYYVRYNTLSPIINTAFSGYPSAIVNVFIDLRDILKTLYGKDLYASKRFVLVSSIINMIAHYRNYFATRHGAYACVYLIYADNSSMNHRQFIPTFGESEYKDTVNFESTDKLIQDQLELVKILTAYIKDAYFIRRTSNFAMFVYDAVSKQPNTPAIIITKSRYAYQIPALFRSAIIVKPKKYNGEDQSYMICQDNVVTNFYKNIRTQSRVDKIMALNSAILSLMMTLTGMPSYHVSQTCSITRSLNLIMDAILNNRIINGYNNDIDYVYDNLIGISKYIDKTNFRFKFSAIDIVFQHRVYLNTPESLDTSWQINLYDPEAVKEINNKYFIDNPLDLELL